MQARRNNVANQGSRNRAARLVDWVGQAVDAERLQHDDATYYPDTEAAEGFLSQFGAAFDPLS